MPKKKSLPKYYCLSRFHGNKVFYGAWDTVKPFAATQGVQQHELIGKFPKGYRKTHREFKELDDAIEFFEMKRKEDPSEYPFHPKHTQYYDCTVQTVEETTLQNVLCPSQREQPEEKGPDLLSFVSAPYQLIAPTQKEVDLRADLLLDIENTFLKKRNEDGETFAHEAVRLKYWEFLEELLYHYPELANQPDEGGRTPLHYACNLNDLKSVKLLIDKGADQQYQTDRGKYRPLDFLNLKASNAQEIFNQFTTLPFKGMTFSLNKGVVTNIDFSNMKMGLISQDFFYAKHRSAYHRWNKLKDRWVLRHRSSRALWREKVKLNLIGKPLRLLADSDPIPRPIGGCIEQLREIDESLKTYDDPIKEIHSKKGNVFLGDRLENEAYGALAQKIEGPYATVHAGNAVYAKITIKNPNHFQIYQRHPKLSNFCDSTDEGCFLIAQNEGDYQQIRHWAHYDDPQYATLPSPSPDAQPSPTSMPFYSTMDKDRGHLNKSAKRQRIEGQASIG